MVDKLVDDEDEVVVVAADGMADELNALPRYTLYTTTGTGAGAGGGAGELQVVGGGTSASSSGESGGTSGGGSGGGSTVGRVVKASASKVLSAVRYGRFSL